MQIRFDPNNILGHLTDTKSVIDNTLETYNKIALETDSSFITAVPDNIKDNILTYVKTRLYDISNNKSSSETLKRDQELLRKFSDDFKLDFERYVSENNQIIDFDQILTSI